MTPWEQVNPWNEGLQPSLNPWTEGRLTTPARSHSGRRLIGSRGQRLPDSETEVGLEDPVAVRQVTCIRGPSAPPTEEPPYVRHPVCDRLLRCAASSVSCSRLDVFIQLEPRRVASAAHVGLRVWTNPAFRPVVNAPRSGKGEGALSRRALGKT